MVELQEAEKSILAIKSVWVFLIYTLDIMLYIKGTYFGKDLIWRMATSLT